jgi:CubicO group peptidase (beta-lactamase class C family)
MTDTTFAPTDEQRARRMAVHSRRSDGRLETIDLGAPIPEPEFWPAGHGAFGTGGDYARFMAALLNDGELDGARILRPETVRLAFEDHLGAIALPEVIETAIPQLSNDIPRAPFAQSWGYGFHVFSEDLPGLRRAGSGDWAGLFNCYFWIDRRSAVACAFLTQVLPFYDQQIVETALAVEQAIYARVASPA